jgi:hypothetical protein
MQMAVTFCVFLFLFYYFYFYSFDSSTNGNETNSNEINESKRENENESNFDDSCSSIVLMIKRKQITKIPSTFFTTTLDLDILCLFFECKLDFQVDEQLIKQFLCISCDNLNIVKTILFYEKSKGFILINELAIRRKQIFAQFDNPTHISWLLCDEYKGIQEYVRNECISRRCHGPHNLILRFLSIG